MKFVMDERIKHRLTGLIVIISIAIIFLPVVMKQSNRRFEENVRISYKLPKKPIPPKVIIPNQNALFKTVKVAKANIVTEPETPKVSVIARAEPLSPKAESRAVVSKLMTKTEKSKKVALVVPASNKKIYGIQLASFSNQRNAQELVAKLHKQGFIARYNKINNQNGILYQVVVGKTEQKNEALNLQKNLAANMQLKGYIINERVS